MTSFCWLNWLHQLCSKGEQLSVVNLWCTSVKSKWSEISWRKQDGLITSPLLRKALWENSSKPHVNTQPLFSSRDPQNVVLNQELGVKLSVTWRLGCVICVQEQMKIYSSKVSDFFLRGFALLTLNDALSSSAVARRLQTARQRGIEKNSMCDSVLAVSGIWNPSCNAENCCLLHSAAQNTQLCFVSRAQEL